MWRQRTRHGVLIAALVIAPLTLGCGEDGPTSVPVPLLGVWDATTFVADGVDLVADGTFISFSFFDDASYAFAVTNDVNGIVCDVPPNCSDSGDFETTGNTLVLDPGTVDELTMTYSVSGTTLTVSGTIQGVTFSAAFDKVA